MDEQRLYVATRDGTLVALRRQDGAEAWRRRGSGNGVAAAAGRAGGARALEGRITSLQPRAGGTRWTAESRRPGVASRGHRPRARLRGRPGPRRPRRRERTRGVDAPPTARSRPRRPCRRDTQLLVGEADGTLRGRDRTTGASLWTFKHGGRPARPRPRRRARATSSWAPPTAASSAFGPTRASQQLALEDRRRRRPRPRPSRATSPSSPPSTPPSTRSTAGSGKLAWRAGLPSRPALRPARRRVAPFSWPATRTRSSASRSLDGQAVGTLKVAAEIRTPPLLEKAAPLRRPARPYAWSRSQTSPALNLDKQGPEGRLAGGLSPACPKRESPRFPTSPQGASSDDEKVPRFPEPRRPPLWRRLRRRASPPSPRPPPAAAAAAAARGRAAASAGSASVAGKVAFEGAAPAAEKVKLNADPKCAAMHKDGLERARRSRSRTAAWPTSSST